MGNERKLEVVVLFGLPVGQKISPSFCGNIVCVFVCVSVLRVRVCVHVTSDKRFARKTNLKLERKCS